MRNEFPCRRFAFNKRRDKPVYKPVVGQDLRRGGSDYHHGSH